MTIFEIAIKLSKIIENGWRIEQTHDGYCARYRRGNITAFGNEEEFLIWLKNVN
jgi:hypothetical protein